MKQTTTAFYRHLQALGPHHALRPMLTPCRLPALYAVACTALLGCAASTPSFSHPGTPEQDALYHEISIGLDDESVRRHWRLVGSTTPSGQPSAKLVGPSWKRGARTLEARRPIYVRLRVTSGSGYTNGTFYHICTIRPGSQLSRFELETIKVVERCEGHHVLAAPRRRLSSLPTTLPVSHASCFEVLVDSQTIPTDVSQSWVAELASRANVYSEMRQSFDEERELGRSGRAFFRHYSDLFVLFAGVNEYAALFNEASEAFGADAAAGALQGKLDRIVARKSEDAQARRAIKRERSREMNRLFASESDLQNWKQSDLSPTASRTAQVQRPGDVSSSGATPAFDDTYQSSEWYQGLPLHERAAFDKKMWANYYNAHIAPLGGLERMKQDGTFGGTSPSQSTKVAKGGIKPAKTYSTCPTCKGSGRSWLQPYSVPKEQDPVMWKNGGYKRCLTCFGEGKIPNAPEGSKKQVSR